MKKRKRAWLKDTVRGKIINIKNPGKNIEIPCNGVTMIFADSVICDVPRAVIANIEDAVTYKYDTSNINIDKEQRKKVPVRLCFLPPESEQVKVRKEKHQAKNEIDDVVIEDGLEGLHDMRANA